MESTLLYKLSNGTSLEHFKRVILVSSPYDQYVPSYSARIQVILNIIIIGVLFYSFLYLLVSYTTTITISLSHYLTITITIISQVSQRAEIDFKNGPSIIKMTSNILSNIQAESLIRVTMFNNIPDTSSTVDTLIGRTAHICYLDNPVVVQQLVYTLYPYLSQLEFSLMMMMMMMMSYICESCYNCIYNS